MKAYCKIIFKILHNTAVIMWVWVVHLLLCLPLSPFFFLSCVYACLLFSLSFFWNCVIVCAELEKQHGPLNIGEAGRPLKDWTTQMLNSEILGKFRMLYSDMNEKHSFYLDSLENMCWDLKSKIFTYKDFEFNSPVGFNIFQGPLHSKMCWNSLVTFSTLEPTYMQLPGGTVSAFLARKSFRHSIAKVFPKASGCDILWSVFSEWGIIFVKNKIIVL